MSKLQEVASLAGVSKATVSRVINNSELVSSVAKQKVMEAINKLQYNSQDMRRTSDSLMTVGVMLPLQESFSRRTFSIDILMGVEENAFNHDYMTLIGNSTSLVKEKELIRQMLQRDVDGIVLLSMLSQEDDEYAAFLTHCGIPLVLVDQKMEGVSANTVRGDNLLGAMTVTSHLLSLGHRNIAAVGLDRYSTFRDRLRGFQFAMMEKGLQPSPANLLVIKQDTELYESIQTCFSRKERPTALFLTGPNQIMPSIHALESLQLRIPEDVSIVVFDDNYGRIPEKYHDFFTSITQSGTLIGKMAIDILIQQIRQPGLANQEIVLPGTLNIRKSTMPPRFS